MATPTRQMSKPQVRPMRARPQASTMMQPPPTRVASQMPARAMPQMPQRSMAQQSVAASPLRMPIASPQVERAQAMQSVPTTMQQPTQRSTGFRPDLAPTGYAPGAGPDMPSRPGGGGVMIMNPDGSERPYGAPTPSGGQGTYIPGTNAAGMPSQFGGNELSSTGQQGMPKYDPTVMGGGELSQPGGGGVMKMMKRGGKVTKPVAYAKGGAVKASSRGDGIAQRGKTKGKIY